MFLEKGGKSIFHESTFYTDCFLYGVSFIHSRVLGVSIGKSHGVRFPFCKGTCSHTDLSVFIFSTSKICLVSSVVPSIIISFDTAFHYLNAMPSNILPLGRYLKYENSIPIPMQHTYILFIAIFFFTRGERGGKNAESITG